MSGRIMALEDRINGDKPKGPRKRGRTLRFDLELAPSTEESTNEFSYTELVDGDERKVTPGYFTGGLAGFCRGNVSNGPD